ncbi:lipopolysaccharide heptosyltransferase II [Halanaerobacter jeridensis]|nr:lipopolysaccharide heptosyltransferase II [Halanaerobacter jeridensis]
MEDEVKNADRIVVIDLLYLGDLIFATPFIKNLRDKYPEARIDFVANANFVSIIEDNPYLDNVYGYNKKWSILESWNFARSLSGNNYDLGLNIHGNWRTALLMKVIGPDYSVGFGDKGRGLFLDQELPRLDEAHMVEVYRQFLRDLGFLELPESELELKVKESAADNVEELLASYNLNPKQNIIALNTGGSWQTKRWPKEKFAALADKLIKKEAGEVIFTGGPSDIERVDEIRELMGEDVVSLAGETTLEELTALADKIDVMVSGDSGPVHVTAAVGTPTITLFGPSNEKKYHPYGEEHQIITHDIECRPCGEHECPLEHHDCLEKVKVNKVFNAITKNR